MVLVEEVETDFRGSGLVPNQPSSFPLVMGSAPTNAAGVSFEGNWFDERHLLSGHLDGETLLAQSNTKKQEAPGKQFVTRIGTGIWRTIWVEGDGSVLVVGDRFLWRLKHGKLI